MDNNNGSIKENLDKLIGLFKKLRNNIMEGDMPEMDRTYFKNLDMLVNNYEMIKDKLSDELIEQLGAPIKAMLSGLVEKLKEELGEDAGKRNNIEDNIRNIEKSLANEGLSDDEINKLLDKRSDLISKKTED